MKDKIATYCNPIDSKSIELIEEEKKNYFTRVTFMPSNQSARNTFVTTADKM